MNEANKFDVNWRKVAEVVNYYRTHHPEEYLGAVRYTLMLRNDLKNKFATDGSESNRRHLCELPNVLLSELSQFNDTVLATEGKNLIQFLKNHREFCIPEKL